MHQIMIVGHTKGEGEFRKRFVAICCRLPHDRIFIVFMFKVANSLWFYRSESDMRHFWEVFGVVLYAGYSFKNNDEKMQFINTLIRATIIWNDIYKSGQKKFLGKYRRGFDQFNTMKVTETMDACSKFK